MKKILSLIAIISFLAISTLHAQQPLTNSSANLVQSVTTYSTSAKQGVVFDKIVLQTVITKVSGAPGGIALPQGSLDGVNYVNISTDTLTYTNQTTNTKIWVLDKTPYLYYRVAHIPTSTTQSSTIVANLLGRALPK